MVNKIKILFICSKNKWRSLTAEKIFHFEHEIDNIKDRYLARIIHELKSHGYLLQKFHGF